MEKGRARWPGPTVSRGMRNLCYGVAQNATVLSGFEDALCLALQLPDPLARDVELVAKLGEGRWLPIVEAVAPHQDVAGSLRQPLDGLFQVGRLYLPHYRVRGVRDPFVLDEVTELRGSLLRRYRLVEARGIGHGTHRETHLLGVPPKASGDLLLGRLSLDLHGELAYRPADLPDLLRHVYRNADGATLVRNSPLDSLPYPPGGVGGEAKTPVRVELLNGLHKPYVALLDQILERQPHPPVLLGHGDDQPQVLLYEPVLGALVAGLGPLGEVYLLLVAEQLALVDAGEVARDEVRGLRPLLRSPCNHSLHCLHIRSSLHSGISRSP